MNIESVREYCLSLPLVTEAFPFDERTLVFRILGKIFACVDLERPEWVTMKCNADNAGCEGIGRIIHFSVVWVMRVSRILRIFAPGNHN